MVCSVKVYFESMWQMGFVNLIFWQVGLTEVNMVAAEPVWMWQQVIYKISSLNLSWSFGNCPCENQFCGTDLLNEKAIIVGYFLLKVYTQAKYSHNQVMYGHSKITDFMSKCHKLCLSQNNKMQLIDAHLPRHQLLNPPLQMRAKAAVYIGGTWHAWLTLPLVQTTIITSCSLTFLSRLMTFSTVVVPH